MSESSALLLARYMMEPQDSEKIEADEDRMGVAYKIAVKCMNEVGDIPLYSS